MSAALVAMTLLPCTLAAPQGQRMLCDFDAVAVTWRSKFRRHAVVQVRRQGRLTKAIRLRFDLSKSPHYDWFRAMLAEPVDVRPYKFLSFWVYGDGNGARMTAMLMRSVPKSKDYPHGEITAWARQQPIVLDFEGWRLYSLPLSAFEDLADVAHEVDMVNFSLQRGRRQAGQGQVMIDEVMLVTEPRGELVPEEVPYPPADIAVKDEADFFSLMDLSRPELADVRAAVQRRDWEAAKQAWAQHLRTRTAPRWTWSRTDKDRIIGLFRERFGGLGRYVPDAERVLARDFQWLGVRKKLSHDIQWLQGPTEWTHVLSRFHYWKTLGYAYWATGDARYAEDFVYMLKDWIADNPVPRILSNSRGKHGTVWRTLEAGIRGDVWLDVMQLFLDAPQFDSDAVYLMTKSLVEHARHLHRYEVAFRYGNWQVVECAGLAAIGIMLPEFKEAEGWRRRAFGYLVQHMERDVYPDGAHHELTPGYHGWVTERFLKVARLCQLNGYQVPGLLDKHEKMFEFLMRISKPDGRFPPLGDAGRGGSIRHYMGLGAFLYGRPDMRYLATDDISSGWIWLFGPEVADKYARLSSAPPKFTSCMLPHAQYCMMRTGWQRDDRYLLFDCAPWGGGHSHNDRLQVVMYAGRDLLIDPGIYSYDEPLSRTYFRSSRAHNVMVIDGGEQLSSDPEVLAWSSTGLADFAAGQIADGNGLRHRRSVLFVKPDYWVVVDHVFGDGEHELTRYFHFPLVEVTHDSRSACTSYPHGTNVAVVCTDGSRVEMLNGWIPVGGAQAKEAPVAAFICRRRLPVALCAVLVPFDSAADIPKIEPESAGGDLAVGLLISHADGQKDFVAIAPDIEEIDIGGWRATGRALCARDGPRASGVFVADGSQLLRR